MTTWLIIGLGNPGPRYASTRHNIGQMVVDELADRRSERFREHKAGARVVETWVRPGGDKIVLAKPNSYMNASGTPVAALAKFYSVDAGNLIVVHDELDIPFDSIRLKRGGGHGGHNGVRDIARAIGSAEFLRVRAGIGRPPGRQDPADWVLGSFGTVEQKSLPIFLSDAADAVEQLIDEGLVAAQQKHHSPRG